MLKLVLELFFDRSLRRFTLEMKKLIDNVQTGCFVEVGRREKTPTPKTRFSIWTLLRTPGRFTTRPLPVHFTTEMSVARPFSVLSKDEIGP